MKNETARRMTVNESGTAVMLNTRPNTVVIVDDGTADSQVAREETRIAKDHRRASRFVAISFVVVFLLTVLGVFSDSSGSVPLGAAFW